MSDLRSTPSPAPETPPCPRKRTDMTPCVVTDGEDARADDGVCVGCGVPVPAGATASAEKRNPFCDIPGCDCQSGPPVERCPECRAALPHHFDTCPHYERPLPKSEALLVVSADRFPEGSVEHFYDVPALPMSQPTITPRQVDSSASPLPEEATRETMTDAMHAYCAFCYHAKPCGNAACAETTPPRYCVGGSIARFTRPVAPTYHCGDPACACMTTGNVVGGGGSHGAAGEPEEPCRDGQGRDGDVPGPSRAATTPLSSASPTTSVAPTPAGRVFTAAPPAVAPPEDAGDVEDNPRTEREQYLVNRLRTVEAVVHEYERQLDAVAPLQAEGGTPTAQSGHDQGKTMNGQLESRSAQDAAVRRYAPNYGEQARGIDAVLLPLGSIEAVERLARDLVAYGYGMAEAIPESSEQFRWHEKAEAARLALMENVRALAATAFVQSTPIPDADAARLLREDPSRQTTGWEAMLVRHVEWLESQVAWIPEGDDPSDWVASLPRDEQGFTRTQDEWDVLAEYARDTADERDWYRSALLEIASGRIPGAVNNERWQIAAQRFIKRARTALRRATERPEADAVERSRSYPDVDSALTTPAP